VGIEPNARCLLSETGKHLVLLHQCATAELFFIRGLQTAVPRMVSDVWYCNVCRTPAELGGGCCRPFCKVI
jgi:hypothetical protein